MAVPPVSSDNGDDLGARIAKLTPREKECLRLVGAPMRTHEIAHQTGLSPATVDTYISSAFKKLGVGDRGTAARLLIAHEGISEKTRSEFPGLDDSPISTAISAPSPWIPVPWSSRGRPRNDLTLPQLIVAILIATVILLGIATLYIAALVALGASV